MRRFGLPRPSWSCVFAHRDCLAAWNCRPTYPYQGPLPHLWRPSSRSCGGSALEGEGAAVGPGDRSGPRAAAGGRPRAKRGVQDTQGQGCRCLSDPCEVGRPFRTRLGATRGRSPGLLAEILVGAQFGQTNQVESINSQEAALEFIANPFTPCVLRVQVTQQVSQQLPAEVIVPADLGATDLDRRCPR